MPLSPSKQSPIVFQKRIFVLTCGIQFDESKLICSLSFFNVYNMKKETWIYQVETNTEGMYTISDITYKVHKRTAAQGRWSRFALKSQIRLLKLLLLGTGRYLSHKEAYLGDK